MARIDGVIEATYAQPSKNMLIQMGVKLVDREKTVKGE